MTAHAHSGIYAIQRKDSDECYIGSAVNVTQRWAGHRNRLLNGKHHSRHLQNVHDKHGMGVLEFVILEAVADKARLIEREQVWLDKFSPAYNTATVAGSTLGVKPSAEHRAAVGAANRSRVHTPESRAKHSEASRGRVKSAETRARLSAASRGQLCSAETRAKISAANMGNKSCVGRQYTPEQRANMSAALKGKRRAPFSDAHRANMSAAAKARHARARQAAA